MQAALLGYAHRTVPRPPPVVGVPQPLLPVVDRRIVVLATHDPAPGGKPLQLVGNAAQRRQRVRPVPGRSLILREPDEHGQQLLVHQFLCTAVGDGHDAPVSEQRQPRRTPAVAGSAQRTLRSPGPSAVVALGEHHAGVAPVGVEGAFPEYADQAPRGSEQQVRPRLVDAVVATHGECCNRFHRRIRSPIMPLFRCIAKPNRVSRVTARHARHGTACCRGRSDTGRHGYAHG